MLFLIALFRRLTLTVGFANITFTGFEFLTFFVSFRPFRHLYLVFMSFIAAVVRDIKK